MKNRPFRVTALAVAGVIAISGCGKEGASPASAPKVAVEKIPPYTYPAPVKGHLKEINIGEFDLVDGIAYPAAGGKGTVVYVVSKPVASPLLADSACPLTQARALSKLRNASFAEVTLDAAGRSRYFAAGAPFAGGLTDLTPRGWSSTLKTDTGRAVGNVVHREYGRFDFDLPLASPKVDEISAGDEQQKRKLAATTPKPTEQAITAAYEALRDAAHRKNLKAMLAALGFDAKQSTAIRGLEGIDADFAVFTDRFLTPGTPGDPWNKPGSGQVRGVGVKADGRKFADDYYFDVCGDHLVLTYIVEQAFQKQ
jgi:hypothetical protein